MSKKAPSFSIRFIGKDIHKETLPFLAAVDAAKAVKSLITQQPVDYDEEQPEEFSEKDSLRIISVTQGSARLTFALPVSNLESRLEKIGKILRSPKTLAENSIEVFFGSIEKLSNLARKLQCKINLEHTSSRSAIASIDGTTFDAISQGMIFYGKTSITAKVERVGGASAQRCTLRIQGRPRLLYAEVGNEETSRRLGKLLYRNVSLSGEAKWIGKNWLLAAFKIESVTEFAPTSFDEAISELSTVAGNAWGQIGSIQEYLTND